MSMKALMTVVAQLLLAIFALGQDGPRPAQTVDDYLSRLPKTLALKENGPHTYLFTCDYFYLDTLGNLTRKERVTGQYTRGLPEGKARWNNVRVAAAKGFDDRFPEGNLRSTWRDSHIAPPTRAACLRT